MQFRRREVWEIFVLPPQFCCELETVLKKTLKNKKIVGKINSRNNKPIIFTVRNNKCLNFMFNIQETLGIKVLSYEKIDNTDLSASNRKYTYTTLCLVICCQYKNEQVKISIYQLIS